MFFIITVNFDNITESTLINVPVGALPEGIEEISKDEIEVLIEVTANSESNSSIQQ